VVTIILNEVRFCPLLFSFFHSNLPDFSSHPQLPCRYIQDVLVPQPPHHPSHRCSCPPQPPSTSQVDSKTAVPHPNDMNRIQQLGYCQCQPASCQMSIIDGIKVGCLSGPFFGMTQLMHNLSLVPSPHLHLQAFRTHSQGLLTSLVLTPRSTLSRRRTQIVSLPPTLTHHRRLLSFHASSRLPTGPSSTTLIPTMDATPGTFSQHTTTMVSRMRSTTSRVDCHSGSG